MTILEALDAPLAGVLGSQLGRWFADLHRAEGVTMLLGARIERVRGRQARARARAGRRSTAWRATTFWWVSASSRTRTGSTEPDSTAGGVPVDPQGRTAAPDVYAAGDAALVFEPALARHVRTDHWEAAARQGAAAARAMLGLEPAAHRCRASGATSTACASSTSAGPPRPIASQSTAIPEAATSKPTFTKAGVPVAALLVGRPRALADARRRVQAGLDSLIPRQQEEQT